MSARVLWVGEAPGKVEETELKPFVGPSGERVRQTLKWAGINVETDVRFTNVVRHNPGTFPSGRAGALLIKSYAKELDDEISAMPNLQVIVACGGVALRRISSYASINDWRGSVIRASDLPNVLEFGGGLQALNSFHDRRIIVIPTLHPAGIMRGGWDEMLLFRRDVKKVAAALGGTLKRVPLSTYFNVPPDVILKAAEGASWVYLDTEYHRDSHQLYWIGLTFDGLNVYGVPWVPEYVDLIRQIMESAQLIKGAHNIAADMEALELAGINLRPPLWDSAAGFQTLYPTLLCRLNVAASYYLDDISYWKDMDHHDPMYNALDVVYGAQCMLAEWREVERRPVDIRGEIAARMEVIPTLYQMYRDGLLVDMPVRARQLEMTSQEIESRNKRIGEAVAPLWDGRVRGVLTALSKSSEALDEASKRFQGQCDRHPTYNGIRKLTSKGCPACADIWSAAKDLRDWFVAAKKVHSFHAKELKRLDGGFSATNPEHLKWLLYSHEALHLPIQRHHKTRQPTTDAEAVDKLSRLAALRSTEKNKRSLSLVLSIKRVQELEKAQSTFLKLERKGVSLIDGNNRVHPVYGRYTETGRMAGDDGDDDKVATSTAFYALNIPKPWRRLYVAPDGYVIVSADWRNLEGRLTAHFSKDPRYKEVLDNELKGGPKVHAVNGAIIFGCDPYEAERFVVELGGQKRTAYELGKKLTHSWSYGMGIDTMMRHYRISRREAERINAALSDAYRVLVMYRQQLIAQVLGVWQGNTCIQAGSRSLANPFGWQRYFMGVGYGQANEVLAFLPQSSGGSMLVRTLPLVSRTHKVMVAVHDSIAVLSEAKDVAVDHAASVLHSEMCKEWQELNGLVVPISVEVGYNWGPTKKDNPRGMTEVR